MFFFFSLALPRVKLTRGDSVIQLPEKFTSIFFFFFFLMNWTHNKEAVAVGVLEPLWPTIVGRRWLHWVPRREASASPKLIYHGSKRSRGSLCIFSFFKPSAGVLSPCLSLPRTASHVFFICVCGAPRGTDNRPLWYHTKRSWSQSLDHIRSPFPFFFSLFFFSSAPPPLFYLFIYLFFLSSSPTGKDRW